MLNSERAFVGRNTYDNLKIGTQKWVLSGSRPARYVKPQKSSRHNFSELFTISPESQLSPCGKKLKSPIITAVLHNVN